MVRPPKKRAYNFMNVPERQTEHHQDASEQETQLVDSNVEDVTSEIPNKLDSSTGEGAMKKAEMSEIDELSANNSLQEDAIAGENQTLTPTKSRFGRSHKPKLLGDFVSTDKKVSIVLKVSPVNQIKYYKDSSRNRDPNRTRSPRKGRPARKSLLRDSFGSQKLTESVPVTASPSVEIDVKIDPKEMEPDPGCEWFVGDLAWARVGNHPFWPCIIARDPEQGIFTRIRMLTKSLVPHRKLHVQFFGDNGRRSWLSSPSVMNYTGRAAFEQLAQKILSSMKRKDPRQVSAVVVKPNLKPVWELAVNEAESLLHSSREERVLHFKRLVQKNALSQKVSEVSGEENILPPPQKVRRQYRKRKAENSEGDPDYVVANKQIKLDNEVETSQVLTPRKRGRPRKTLDTSDKDTLIKQESTKESSPAANTSKLDKTVVKMEVDEKDESISVQSEAEQVQAESLLEKTVDEQLDSEERPKKKFRTPTAKSAEQMSKVKNKKQKLGAEFNNFSSKQFNKVSSENPEMGTKEVEDHLEKIWNGLDDAKKSKYRIKLTCKDKDDDEEEESVTWDPEDTDEKTSTSEISESPLTLPPPKSRSKVSIFNGAFQGKVCQVCEKPGNTFRCKGPCFGTYHLECAANPRDFSARINEIFQSVNTSSSPATVAKKKKLDGRRKKSDVLIKTEVNSEDSVSNEAESEVDPSEASASIEIKKEIEVEEAVALKVDESNDSGDVSVSEAKVGAAAADKKKAAKGKGGSKESCDSSEEADSQSADFRCAACSEGRLQPCFVCGREEFNGENTRQRCHVSYCGRVYHLECLKAWPQVNWIRSAGSIRSGGGNGNGRRSDESKGKPVFACPQHACHTCISDNPSVMKERFANDRLVKCLRCPTSYHYGNHCLPAGTEIITARQIICPQHYKKHKKGLLHVNASWCFICASGGSLICCDMCPTAFHADCLKISPPEGGYICEDCETGRFPLYGEIVWVKLGVYRWWPAQIMFPHQIPENIRNLVHARGEFAVKFFGSHDFYWVNRGRVFLYQEGDSGGRCTSKRKATDQMFLRAVEEASEACTRLKNEKASREASHRSGMKPPSYIRIKTNKPVGQVRAMEANISSLTPCECDPNSANPCALDTDCLNRILMIECNPLICPAGPRCKNQLFEKREYPPLMPYRTDGRGWGLKTLVDLKKGEFVIEYVGEMINEVEYQRRLQKMHESNENNYYFLTIDKDRMLDAGPKGNVARFMNHSCQPNCETQKWTVNGDTRVGLFALHDIPAETELVFNYNLESIGSDKKACMCGAPNCSGFIGVKASKNGNGNNADDSVQEKPKKPRRRSRSSKPPAKLSDDFCFICDKGGELLLCDGKSCTKAYHLNCLSRNKKHPVGYWLCPWHQCNVCCKGKVYRCNFCINSYCPTHAEGNIHLEESIGYVCSKHGSKKGDKNKTDDKSKTATAESRTSSPKGEESISPEVKDQPVTEVDVPLPQGISEGDSSSSGPHLVPSEKQNNNVESSELDLKAFSCSPRARRPRSNSDVNQKTAESEVKLLRRIRRPASVDSVCVSREVEVPLKETLFRSMVSKRRRSMKNTLQEEKNGTDGDSSPCIYSKTSKENTEPKETTKTDEIPSTKCVSPIVENSVNGHCNEVENADEDSLKIKEASTFSPSSSANKTDGKADESGKVVENSTCKAVEEENDTSEVSNSRKVVEVKGDGSEINGEKTGDDILETKTEDKNEGSKSKSSHSQETSSELNNDESDEILKDCESSKVNDEAVDLLKKLPSSAANVDEKTEATENSKPDVFDSRDCDLDMEVFEEPPKDLCSDEVVPKDGSCREESCNEGSTKEESCNEGITNDGGSEELPSIEASVPEEKSEFVEMNGLADECSEIPSSLKDVVTQIDENNKTIVLDKNSSEGVSEKETSKKLVEDHRKTILDTVVDCNNSETNGNAVIPENKDVCVMKKSANSKKRISPKDQDSLVT